MSLWLTNGWACQVTAESQALGIEDELQSNLVLLDVGGVVKHSTWIGDTGAKVLVGCRSCCAFGESFLHLSASPRTYDLACCVYVGRRTLQGSIMLFSLTSQVLKGVVRGERRTVALLPRFFIFTLTFTLDLLLILLQQITG